MIDRMVCTAMAGARNAVDHLAVTTNNLAHAATPGFREQLAAFRSVPVLGDGARTRLCSVHRTPGSSSVGGRVAPYGNPTHLPLEVDGGFLVQPVPGSTPPPPRAARTSPEEWACGSSAVLPTLRGWWQGTCSVGASRADATVRAQR